MTKTSKQQLGQKGEDLAADYLQKRGHKIVTRNYRHGKGELDIVSINNDVLVVSEVKSFYTPPLGAAEFRVNKAKQQQIIQTTYAFLAGHPDYGSGGVRFDVIVVDFSAWPARITHHQAAFWDERGWD